MGYGSFRNCAEAAEASGSKPSKMIYPAADVARVVYE
jgi:hypothetical protein